MYACWYSENLWRVPKQVSIEISCKRRKWKHYEETRSFRSELLPFFPHLSKVQFLCQLSNINHLIIMPKASSKKVKIMQETEEFISSPELCEDEFPMKNGAKSLMKSNRISKYETDTKSGGTYCAVANNTNTDLGNDLRKVLDMFGADVNKALRAKKQQLEQYSAGAMKANETRIKEMLQCQSEARMHHHEEMCRNVNSVLEQWNVDLAHSKDNEEKMIKIVQKQIKIIQQNRTSQLQRLAYLRQIHESYQKNFLQEEAKQNDQCLSMLQELRRELNELQKKMVVDNQKVEVAQMQEALKRSVSFI